MVRDCDCDNNGADAAAIAAGIGMWALQRSGGGSTFSRMRGRFGGPGVLVPNN